MKRLILAALAAFMMLGGSAAEASSQQNGLQPSPVFFREVQAGQHPWQTVAVLNPTNGRNQYIRSIQLSGAGGGKFSYTWGHGATCRVGLNLLPGQSCTLTIRVKTEVPEWYESHMLIIYGPRLKSRPNRGNWNGAVYAHVV